jgi:outer membrane protein TolC
MKSPAESINVTSHRLRSAPRPSSRAWRPTVVALALAAGSSLAVHPVAAQVAPVSTPAQIQAPAVPAGPLTLEQVLAIAEAQSESVAIARVAIARNDGDQLRARSGRLPQLSAAATYDRSLANEFQGVFDNIDFGGSDSGSDSGGSLEDLPFGRANTWRASLSFTQNIYSGGRLGAQARLADIGRTSAEQGLLGARAQLHFDVTQAYYDALLSERLVVIAEATLDQAGATLRQTQAGFDAGTQPEFEVLRATVSRDNQTPLLIRQRANRDVAKLRLKQLLGLPADYDLRLADDLGDPALAPAPVFAERVLPIEGALRSASTSRGLALPSIALPDRNAIAEAGTLVSLREATLKAVEAERKPSVALNSTYSRIAYPSAFFPTFDRSNWSVGASLNVPILTGGRQKGDEVVARADIDQAKLQKQQAEELAALDTRSAWAELVAARSAWEATAGTVQQATRAYQIADVRFQAGVSTQLELSDSRLLLQQAEANRALAARDLQVARARVALLPNLPLGAGAATAAGARATTPQTPAAPQQPQQGGTQFTSASGQPAQQTGTR